MSTLILNILYIFIFIPLPMQLCTYKVAYRLKPQCSGVLWSVKGTCTYRHQLQVNSVSRCSLHFESNRNATNTQPYSNNRKAKLVIIIRININHPSTQALHTRYNHRMYKIKYYYYTHVCK